MRSAFSQAWASWKTAPGVALLAVVAFAVGIGSSTAIFTVINGVLLRPLPYPGGERFVSLYSARTTASPDVMRMSVAELQDYQQQTTSFDAFGWFRTGRYHLTAPGDPQFVPGAAVTPALARNSVRRSSASGSPMTAARSSRALSGDASAAGATSIGSAITLDDRRYTISGVMPPAFQMPVAEPWDEPWRTEVWIPLDPSPRDANRGSGPSSHTPAANRGCRWNRRRRTSGASPPPSPRQIRTRIQFYTARGGRPAEARSRRSAGLRATL